MRTESIFDDTVVGCEVLTITRKDFVRHYRGERGVYLSHGQGLLYQAKETKEIKETFKSVKNQVDDAIKELKKDYLPSIEPGGTVDLLVVEVKEKDKNVILMLDQPDVD